MSVYNGKRPVRRRVVRVDESMPARAARDVGAAGTVVWSFSVEEGEARR